MTAQGVRKLEQGEANGTISLNTLARLAQGLDCEVHYVLVPLISLVEQVIRRTHEVAGTPLSRMQKVTELLKDAEALDSMAALLVRIPALLNTPSGDVINSTVDHERRQAF